MSAAEAAAAAAGAAAAFPGYRATSPAARAAFLESVADRIDALGDALPEQARAETGLPLARLRGEQARTTGQLRLFAAVLRDGEWQGVRIEPALPDRKPLPRPDLRQRRVPLGPVAVFAASNFPLAFSTAGGDTASALAAGCPVVLKAHPEHPATSDLVAGAIREAVAEHGLPEGTFTHVHGGHETGTALVADPRIRAVGFTGSRAGGLALAGVAAARPVPIPVYAEMSSVNPVFLLPGALRADAERLGREFAASLTGSAGQLCTNPGLVFAVDGDGFEEFLGTAAREIAATEPQRMLSPGIHRGYRDGVDRLAKLPGATRAASGKDDDSVELPGRAELFTVDDTDFLAEPAFQDEVFGATSLVVRVRPGAEGVAARLRDITAALEGQLTATVHGTDDDLGTAAALLPDLELLAGRVVWGGWPTGVDVGHAMVHGGPFPATTAPATTSVGSRAIERFLRPVAYQNVPQQLLPEEVRNV
ncbi:aldehyde dehydrogenase (NADP(+)) [Streptomyces sp. NPDC051940]|uniref:aldehyde dehydrogenase (NADP(+)) n=1 Tax=Streptomyces sp. NPDC051940 TaxID=3155675 RepID=UPI00341215D1